MANPALNAYIATMNGDLFIRNDEGEADMGTPNYVVVIPRFTDANHAAPTPNQVLRVFADTVEIQDPNATPRIKNLILGSRYSAYRLNLLKPNDMPAEHNCNYTEVEYRDFANAAAIPPAPTWVDYAILTSMAKQATNIICLCAYFFRSRGHHFKESFEDDVAAKWSKNLNAGAFCPTALEWGAIFTRGLHAIFPDDLDNFWSTSIDEHQVCRPFALRYNVPCAGTAPFFALYAGITEARLIMPGAFKSQTVLLEQLESVCTDLLINRWKGGINRTFYRGAALNIKEGTFAALAAIVYGLNTPAENVTALGRAPSLARVAGSAPLTTIIIRAAATGIIRRCGQGEVQGSLGDRALKQIVFNEEESREA